MNKGNTILSIDIASIEIDHEKQRLTVNPRKRLLTDDINLIIKSVVSEINVRALDIAADWEMKVVHKEEV